MIYCINIHRLVETGTVNYFCPLHISSYSICNLLGLMKGRYLVRKSLK